jgi:hypothetical protein
VQRPSAKFVLLCMPYAIASLPIAQATLDLFAVVREQIYENVYHGGEALPNLA